LQINQELTKLWPWLGRHPFLTHSVHHVQQLHLTNTFHQFNCRQQDTFMLFNSILRLILRTLGPLNVFILLNGWICLHGVRLSRL